MLNSSSFVRGVTLDDWDHLQLNVEVAVTLVGNVELQSLGEPDGYGSEVQIVGVNADQTV